MQLNFYTFLKISLFINKKIVLLNFVFLYIIVNSLKVLNLTKGKIYAKTGYVAYFGRLGI